jgi:hypothetical protein
VQGRILTRATTVSWGGGGTCLPDSREPTRCSSTEVFDEHRIIELLTLCGSYATLKQIETRLMENRLLVTMSDRKGVVIDSSVTQGNLKRIELLNRLDGKRR